MKSGIIFTVGHGTRTTEELVAVLHSADVGFVIDVRRFPGSRRHPHLSMGRLKEDLPALGVSYEWWGEALGGRRGTASSATRHAALRNRSFRSYANHMDTEQFRAAVASLAALASSGPTPAIMCAETLWWRCHRKLIADALQARGLEVVHIIDENRTQAHSPPAEMRLDEEGWPVYDDRAPRLPLE